ncbi:MAG: (4Fe-4S)-binding protein [Streptococcaceae bacterium]|jgi:uncharacterized Fe-S cluster protein YjdI|nr:(4Fe-4S)-binding protein [Streptococcaceae bacterium]
MDGSKIFELDVTPELLSERGYKKYSGKDIDIYYNKDICQHAGMCVRGSSEVYEVGRRPWIIADNESATRNIEIVNDCPSGALKYIRKSEV